MIMGLILILIGSSMQNIFWYIRLQNPLLLREFQMYWILDGAKLFLEFNFINYFSLVLVTTLYAVVCIKSQCVHKRELENKAKKPKLNEQK